MCALGTIDTRPTDANSEIHLRDLYLNRVCFQDEKIIAEITDEKPTANGDAKVENGEVKSEELNGDVKKEEPIKDDSVIKEEAAEDDTEKEKGEGDSKETEEGADKVEEKKKDSKATNLRKKLSFKKSFSFLRKKAAKEA